MAPVLSVVVTGTGTVPLEVPFPPAVPFIPPAPPATVELLPPAPVVELLAPVWRAPAAPASVTVEVELALDAPVATITTAVPADEVAVTVVDDVEPDDAPVATITVAVSAGVVAVTVVADVEPDDAAASASRKRCQQFPTRCENFHGLTFTIVGAVGEDGVGIGTGRARLDGAVVNTVHKARLGAEADSISRAIGAAKAGGLGQHVPDACLLHEGQQIVRSSTVVSQENSLRRTVEGYSAR